MKKRGKYFTCEKCNTEFYRKKSYVERGHNTRFCSVNCYTTALKDGEVPNRARKRPELKRGASFNCTICGKEFYRKQSLIDRGITKTCGSTACKGAYLKGSNNPFWGQNLSEDVKNKIEEDGRDRKLLNFTLQQRKDWKDDKCAWCGSTERLELDHIIPTMAGGGAYRENAQTLCKKCNIWKMSKVDRPFYLAKLAIQGG